MNLNAYQSALSMLHHLAITTPERPIYTFVSNNGRDVKVINCLTVWQRAQQIAYDLLVTHQLSQGDCVLLVYPPGLEFVEAFLGCLYAGIIPVPVPPPMPINPESGLNGYQYMAKDCNAVAQLTNQQYSLSRTFGRIRQALTFGKKWPKLPWIITDKLKQYTELKPIAPHSDEIAFLQYTSGSTRAPKGVCITFGNIWHQISMNRIELDMNLDSTSVIWLPHYHDFSLISGILNAACGNNQLILFSPLEFLRRPALWGELLHRYQATHTAAPDFGYKLFTKRTTEEACEAWDFSSLRVVMSAAEPIEAKTVDDFLNTFAKQKLNPNSFCPSYGLAEHTVAVTSWGRKRFKFDRNKLEQELILHPAKDTAYVELFGCGQQNQNVNICIVDPIHKKVLSEGCVGEIWVDSPSKAQGYFNQPDETISKFSAKLAHEDSTSWLRTGDLGAFYHDELFIVGRLDDMIILDGRNIFPQDIESIIGSCDSRIKPGRVIAFDILNANQEKEIIAVLELRKKNTNSNELLAIVQNIRNSLQQELRLIKITIAFANNGNIPKTTSGKLQRKKCRANWLLGEVDCYHIVDTKAYVF